ncbi:MAG: PEP-CTERM sorting domain-containing protein [Planctomycetota bacterium]|nr:PEP-CTERM sorting domain-containing protein [Planctomycetota bacterium]
MRRILTIMALLIPMALAGAASASVMVDFSTMGGNTAVITLPNPPLAIGAMSFTYDNFSIPADYAWVDATGIFGTTGGALGFNFTPSTALSFNFTQLNATAPLANPMFISLYSGGADVADLSAATVFNPTNGNATGTFSYSGAAVDQALMFFSPETQYFTADTVSYTPTPEPATMGLLAIGLIGLARRRIFSR